MVDKVNGKAKAGEFLGKNLDFYTVAFTADTNTVVDGSASDAVVEAARAKAANDRRERIVETISLNGQPIIFGTLSDTTAGAQSVKFAIEHAGAWQRSSGTQGVGTPTDALKAAFESVPGVTAVTVTKADTL